MREINYLFDLAAGTTIETWIAFGKEKYKFELGAGCTAVMGPDIPGLGERRNVSFVTQAQVAATVAAAVGMDWVKASGAAPPLPLH